MYFSDVEKTGESDSVGKPKSIRGIPFGIVAVPEKWINSNGTPFAPEGHNRRCSERKNREQTAACTKQSCELSTGPTFVSLCSGYLWCSLNRKESERDPEYCKNGCETCSWGTCDTGSRSRKRPQFSHCVCSHWHVCPRSMGNNSPVFCFSGTGLLTTELATGWP